MGRCRYTRHQPPGDVDGVVLRLGALWVVISGTPATGGVQADDKLLDWVARAAVRGHRKH